MTRNVLIPLAAAVLAFASCQVERAFPDQVASGAGRLTIRNTATVVSLINGDDRCGFSATEVQDAGEYIGEIGEVGTYRTRVDACEIDLGELHVAATDCNGVERSVGGKITVSGVRDIDGALTGSPAKPVIPVDPSSVHLSLEVTFDDFVVEMSDKISVLTQNSGKLTFDADVPLAVSSDTGLCSIPTSQLSLKNIAYQDAVLTVSSGEGQPFEVEVPTSSLNAQLGRYNDAENTIDGSITVWDSTQKLPLADEDPALDPDYVRADFEGSFACAEELAQPLSFECAALGPKLAAGAAPLSIRNFGNIAKLAEERCFANATNPTITGDMGMNGGQARWDVSSCVIDLPSRVTVSTDCLGTKTEAQGRIVVSGSKTITGLLTGDPAEPVIPQSMNPAVINLTVEFDENKPFTVIDESSTKWLELKGGRMSGTSRPKVGMDTEKGACAVVLPIVTFEHIVIEDAEATLMSDGRAFNMHIDHTALDAQNGQNGNRENYLAGTFTVEGTEVPIPREGDPILDPNYSASSFYSSFACAPNLEMVESDAECSIMPMLGENAARLLVQTAGTLAGWINKDDDCGFEDYMLLISPSEVIGDTGEMGSMSWDVDSCELGDSGLSTYATDCLGGQTMTSGVADVSASRTVVGEREKKFLVVDSIIPRSRDAVSVSLSAELDEFLAYSVAAGETEPKGVLTIHSGLMNADVSPRLGERADDPGIFDVPTPAAEIASITMDSAVTTLESAGKTFELTLTDVQLYARNGTFDGFGNVVRGSLRVNGELVELGSGVDLNPDYNQSTFDASYACTENLAGPIPTQ